MALNPKQEQFVAEFLIDGNATQAAIRAGYSKDTAYSQGHRLLKHAEVRAAIDEGRQAALQAAGAEAIAVIRELVSIANSDVSELLDGSGRLRKLSDLPPNVRRAIASFEVEQEAVGAARVTDDGMELDPQTVTTTRVKFWDKTKALELLGKHLKMFTDKAELAGADGEPLSITINRTVKK